MSKRYWVHVAETNEELGPFDTIKEAEAEAAANSLYGENTVAYVYRQGEAPIYLYADGFKHRVDPEILVDPRNTFGGR